MFAVYSSEEAYQEDKRNSTILRMILDKCEQFEGKDISKRIVTHLNNELPEFRFYLDKQEHSCSYLHVTPENGKTVRVCRTKNEQT